MDNIGRYKTLVFDCDGVVLKSNSIKTEAFHKVALPYGVEQAEALVAFHVRNGGISRYVKLSTLFSGILKREPGEGELQSLIDNYSLEVRQQLLHCEIALGLERLRQKTADAKWLLVSGGDQEELRQVFQERNIAHWFDGGIFGSPDNKDLILAREMKLGNLAFPAIFFGDSRYDHEAATRANLAFCFISAWTELADWRAYCAAPARPAISGFNEILS